MFLLKKLSSMLIWLGVELVVTFEIGLGIYEYVFYVFVLMSVQVAKELKALRSGTNNNRKLHWIAWDQVLADKKHGGLDIGSLVSLNFSLLLK
uniref:Uncharacterized protein n=1 Tax=Lactuca sativa TaxID=4236 RepID=A0A9R1V112_LACSA|nr:hypothetical protein LSAT_V11C700384640 [Lactuca sativa]